MGKGNGQTDRTSALTNAAAALDAELRRYADLSAAAVKVPLSSEKNLERASRALLDAAESEHRVIGHVKSLVEAINAAREAQQASSETLSARAATIAQRKTEIDLLLARFAKLGEVGQTLNAALQKVMGYKPDPYGKPEEAKEVLGALEAIANGMQTCAEHAQELATDAQAREFDDLARQADGLRQQILSAKNRLALLQKGFGGS